VNSGRILTLKVFCELKNGCALGAEEDRVFVPRGSALAFYTFANQAAVDSSG